MFVVVLFALFVVGLLWRLRVGVAQFVVWWPVSRRPPSCLGGEAACVESPDREFWWGGE